VVRRGIFAAAVGLGLCAGFAEARADQVVLSMAAYGQYIGGSSSLGGAVAIPPQTIVAGLVPRVGGVTSYLALLEFSLAPLPGNAVVTSASLTYEAGLGVLTHNPVPCAISITMRDGKDGIATLDDVFRSPSEVEASFVISENGVQTTPLSDISFLNQRSTYFPTGYVSFSFGPGTSNADVTIVHHQLPSTIIDQLPILTITYSVPEPASVGVLGAASLMLLRRRR
jgi:hypothetical protein